MKKAFLNFCEYLFNKFGVFGAGMLSCMLCLVFTSFLLINHSVWYWLAFCIGNGLGTVSGIKIGEWLTKE